MRRRKLCSCFSFADAALLLFAHLESEPRTSERQNVVTKLPVCRSVQINEFLLFNQQRFRRASTENAKNKCRLSVLIPCALQLLAMVTALAKRIPVVPPALGNPDSAANISLVSRCAPNFVDATEVRRHDVPPFFDTRLTSFLAYSFKAGCISGGR